jgi:CO/xanthine dehydrogenase Mo-binding subunit
MAASKQVVGNPTPRVEGELKVSGKAKYAVDVTLPAMLWGKLYRSPIASGKIKRIDVSKAEALPGVHAVVTGKDCTGLRIGRRLYDMPILADGEVRFIGEKVAAVAADNESIAEEALNLIEVEYEETEPLLDPVDAMNSGAKLLHPDVMHYKGLPKALEAPSNEFVYVTWKKGEIETGFRQADIIVENTFTTPVVHHAYIEPHSCVANVAPDGSAEIWACSKVPYAIREQVATALQVEQEKLVINPCYIGGDFGGKGDFMDVAVAYLLSKKAGQPVKLVMDYDEEFVAGNPRHASIIRVKTGVKKDGTIVAHHMDFVFDSGAYGAFKPNAFLNGPHGCAGPYNIPHCFIEEHMVYTAIHRDFSLMKARWIWLPKSSAWTRLSLGKRISCTMATSIRSARKSPISRPKKRSRRRWRMPVSIGPSQRTLAAAWRSCNGSPMAVSEPSL